MFQLFKDNDFWLVSSFQQLDLKYLRLLVWLKLWSLHDEKAGQNVYKYPFNPGRHAMGLRGAKVYI